MNDILKYNLCQVALFSLGLNLLTTLIGFLFSSGKDFSWIQSLVGDAFGTLVITLGFYFYKKYKLKNEKDF